MQSWCLPRGASAAAHRRSPSHQGVARHRRSSPVANGFAMHACMRTVPWSKRSSVMSDVSTFRLYLLRATYLLIAVGLGITIWPDLVQHALAGNPTPRATPSLLAGVSLLALLGLRFPLRMLPLLLFELIWKSIWLIAVALPLWNAHQIDADT